jgi:hypothetical protein
MLGYRHENIKMLKTYYICGPYIFPNLQSLELVVNIAEEITSELFANMPYLQELNLPFFHGTITSLPKGLITLKLPCTFVGILPELPPNLKILSLEENMKADFFRNTTATYQTCELPNNLTILKCGNYRFHCPLPSTLIHLSMNTLPRTIFFPPSVKELQLRNYCEGNEQGFDTWFDFKHITKFTFYAQFVTANLKVNWGPLRYLDMPNWFIHKNTQSQLLPPQLQTLKIFNMEPDVMVPNGIRYLHFYGKVVDDVKSLPTSLLQLTFQHPNVQPIGLLKKAYRLAGHSHDVLVTCWACGHDIFDIDQVVISPSGYTCRNHVN